MSIDTCLTLVCFDNGSEYCDFSPLFVGGLNDYTTDNGLCKPFEQYGELTDCVVIQNLQLLRSGFVTASAVEADTAMSARAHALVFNNVEQKSTVAREDDELLDEYFQFDTIEKAEVIINNQTGKKRDLFFKDTDYVKKPSPSKKCRLLEPRGGREARSQNGYVGGYGN
uniref:RRM domain-containing protein n=1 Tax=Oncorhynchus mykiss TaxID=8022 RepID=A0A8K9XTK5_ONCMY